MLHQVIEFNKVLHWRIEQIWQWCRGAERTDAAGRHVRACG